MSMAFGARLNLLLQERFNAPLDAPVDRFGSFYGVGEKVMHAVNDR